MKFNCISCNYATDIKSNFKKNNSTEKHIQKCKLTGQLDDDLQNVNIDVNIVNPNVNLDVNTSMEKSYNALLKSISDDIKVSKCDTCDFESPHRSSLSRHKKKCEGKTNNCNTMIQEFTKQLEEKNKKIEELTTTETNRLKEEVKYLKTLVSSAGTIVNKSVSALSYIATNYKNAPPLKSLPNYLSLEADKENNVIMSKLMYHHNHDTVGEYLGDFIIKNYKKEDPAEQSIWNSDCGRLTYIIRDIINNKSDWTVDKKGLKTDNYIIDPLLKFIRKLLGEFIDENNIKIQNSNKNKLDISVLLDEMRVVTHIITSIEDRSLAMDISKFIAPYFYLNSNHNNNVE